MTDQKKPHRKSTPLYRFVKRVLVLAAQHDVRDEISWNEDLEFWINCSDFFFWGTDDAEDLKKKDLAMFEQSCIDAGDYGALLYCARKRKMRPHGAYYRYINQELWPLFNAAGPVRGIYTTNQKKPGA